MDHDSHYRKLENMYHAALCNQYFSPKLSVKKGKAEVDIPIKVDFHHSANAVHGSVYFKALDDAAFFSANSLVEDVLVLTSNFTVFLTRPISSGNLRARGEVVHSARSLFIAEAVLYNGQEQEIARGLGSFMRSKIPLTDEIGYK